MLFPAHRTWATGYGHRVDRAVLAAALYREAGFSAEPLFRAHGIGDTLPQAPGLQWSEGVSLSISGHGVAGLFDPASAAFSTGGLDQVNRCWL